MSLTSGEYAALLETQQVSHANQEQAPLAGDLLLAMQNDKVFQGVVS